MVNMMDLKNGKYSITVVSGFNESGFNEFPGLANDLSSPNFYLQRQGRSKSGESCSCVVLWTTKFQKPA